MIYTRFGSEVEIISVDKEWVKVKRVKDGSTVDFMVCELKADNGYKEIEEAIKKVL